MTNHMSTDSRLGEENYGSAQSETEGSIDVGNVRDVVGVGISEVSRLGGEVKSQTSHLVSEAGAQARDRAETQLGRVAGMLGQVGEELRRMADGASSSDNYLAVLARDGADAARRISTRLERDGFDGAARDVKQFARRRPLLYLAGAAAAGLAVGRLTRNIDPRQIVPQAGADQPTGMSTLPPRMPIRPVASNAAPFAEPVL